MIKTWFIDWIKRFKGDGLVNIYRANTLFMRIFWIICYSAGIGYSFYIVSLSIQEFLKFETIVSTKYIREAPTEFPAVTICNLNPFDDFYANAYMTSVAKTLKETQNCKSSKTFADYSLENNMFDKVFGSDLNYTQLCSNNTQNGQNLTNAIQNGFQLVWCNMTTSDLSSVAYYELQYALSENWTLINSNWSLTVDQTFNMIGWPTTGWFKYMKNTEWKNWTLDKWIDYYNIDRTIMINPGTDLIDCLKLMSTDQLSIIQNRIKRNIANKNLTNADMYWLGFTLEIDTVESCQLNQMVCKIYDYNMPGPFFSNGDFTQFWDNQYGNCFTFNDGSLFPSLKTSKSGPNNGLKMTIKPKMEGITKFILSLVLDFK